MADSNITKNALAAALEELMGEMPFDKIKISDICDRCGMNRKGFYYHFRDKYDLVRWIFDNEFFQEISRRGYCADKQLLLKLCDYFYQKRDFYRRAFKIEGQNSFREYFRDVWEAFSRKFVMDHMPEMDNWEFYSNFCADTFVGSMVRWLKEKECMPPEEFVRLLEESFYHVQKALEEYDIAQDTE